MSLPDFVLFFGHKLSRISAPEELNWHYRGDVNGIELDVSRLPPNPDRRQLSYRKPTAFINVIAIGDVQLIDEGFGTTLSDSSPEDAVLALELRVTAQRTTYVRLSERPAAR